MQAVKCSPADLNAINGNTYMKPKAALVCWLQRFLPSALASSRRIDRTPADVQRPEASPEEDTERRGKHADARGPTTPPIPVSSRSSVPPSDSATAANDVPSSIPSLLSEKVPEEEDCMKDSFVLSTTKGVVPEIINESSTKEGVGEESAYVGCRELQIQPEECESTGDTEDASLVVTGTSEKLCPACYSLVKRGEKSAVARDKPEAVTGEALQSAECDQTPPLPSPNIQWQHSGRGQQSLHQLSAQEGQPQPEPNKLLFGPAAWASLTSFWALMFSSCVGLPTPLHHERIEKSAEAEEDENNAALKSHQGTLWSESNLQLACGTRCRKLRRVKDEGRQVWMEYQEVTLHDNSKRFQWVELTDDTDAAVE
ncbi:hypothetical protein, conserved [Eimeria brunetti]|uniref:Uncharacterized protein n=1 Tax=Eimeria brunetti TaxID=51314 RepID=U6LET6_9EIME|nr:hypothetical protein, conserved [Eimeria brunetti]